MFYLNILRISQEDYNHANGKNVVYDVAYNSDYKFYSIKCWYFDKNNEYIALDFFDLKDKHSNKHFPIHYVDANKNSLIPSFSTVNPESSCYTIEYNSFNLIFGGSLKND